MQGFTYTQGAQTLKSTGEQYQILKSLRESQKQKPKTTNTPQSSDKVQIPTSSIIGSSLPTPYGLASLIELGSQLWGLGLLLRHF